MSVSFGWPMPPGCLTDTLRISRCRLLCGSGGREAVWWVFSLPRPLSIIARYNRNQEWRDGIIVAFMALQEAPKDHILVNLCQDIEGNVNVIQSGD